MTVTSYISEQMLSLCDTHTHLAFNHFDHDRDNILKQLEDGYLKFLIEVGTTLEDSKRAIELASRSEKIFVAVGVHPHESSGVTDGYLNELKKLAKKSTVVAIGEVGLDYFRDLSPREIQQKVFYEQLLLAQELDMPVVIHIRDAYNEAYEILKKFSGKLRGVIHAFSGTLEDALRFTELGFKLGIGGPITYPKNNKFREIVKILPIETLIPETDCPYLPPQPYRGKRNEPAYVRFVIEKISELKDLPVRTCADILCANAASLFSLDV